MQSVHTSTDDTDLGTELVEAVRWLQDRFGIIEDRSGEDIPVEEEETLDDLSTITIS